MMKNPQKTKNEKEMKDKEKKLKRRSIPGPRT